MHSGVLCIVQSAVQISAQTHIKGTPSKACAACITMILTYPHQ